MLILMEFAKDVLQHALHVMVLVQINALLVSKDFISHQMTSFVTNVQLDATFVTEKACALNATITFTKMAKETA